jgi:hypothetical protein
MSRYTSEEQELFDALRELRQQREERVHDIRRENTSASDDDIKRDPAVDRLSADLKGKADALISEIRKDEALTSIPGQDANVLEYALGNHKPPWAEGKEVEVIRHADDETRIRASQSKLDEHGLARPPDYWESRGMTDVDAGKAAGSLGPWAVGERPSDASPQGMKDGFALRAVPNTLSVTTYEGPGLMLRGEAGPIAEWGPGGGIQEHSLDGFDARHSGLGYSADGNEWKARPSLSFSAVALQANYDAARESIALQVQRQDAVAATMSVEERLMADFAAPDPPKAPSAPKEDDPTLGVEAAAEQGPRRK